MPIEPVSHKYAVIINAVQSRIEQGVYAPGTMLPTEADFVHEFGASRSTVVKALRFLSQHAWLQGVQGRGRIVLGRPVVIDPPAPARIRHMLNASEATNGTVLHVGPFPAPDHVAAVLGVPVRSRIAARRRRLATTEPTTVVVDTVYLLPDVARRAGLDATAPIRDGLLRRLERRGLLPYEVVEHISARPPSTQEMTLLQVGRHDCLMALRHVVHNRDGHALMLVDTAIPAKGTSLVATYSLG